MEGREYQIKDLLKIAKYNLENKRWRDSLKKIQ